MKILKMKLQFLKAIIILFIASFGDYKVSAQIITTFAGTGNGHQGGNVGDGDSATKALFFKPTGICLDTYGNIYITETGNPGVRKINHTTSIVTTVIGNGSGMHACTTYDNWPATDAELSFPYAVSVDNDGNIYVADESCRIKKVNISTGRLIKVVDNGSTLGDGGMAIDANVSTPRGIFVDSFGNLYISDSGHHRIRKINGSSGIINTIAGTGTYGYSGDGGLATNAQINDPTGICIDDSNNVYFAEAANDVIRKINVSTGIIYTIANVNSPRSIFLDKSNNLYIVSDLSNKIYKKNVVTGVMDCIAGTGANGYFGDGGNAISAKLNYPWGICVDESGNIYITDTYNNRIRKITAGSSASIKDISFFREIIVNPNPGSDILNIAGVDQYVTFKLYDALGNIVQDISALKLVNKETSLNISNLPQGIYSLIIENEKGRDVRKVVISR